MTANVCYALSAPLYEEPSVQTEPDMSSLKTADSRSVRISLWILVATMGWQAVVWAVSLLRSLQLDAARESSDYAEVREIIEAFSFFFDFGALVSALVPFALLGMAVSFRNRRHQRLGIAIFAVSLLDFLFQSRWYFYESLPDGIGETPWYVGFALEQCAWLGLGLILFLAGSSPKHRHRTLHMTVAGSAFLGSTLLSCVRLVAASGDTPAEGVVPWYDLTWVRVVQVALYVAVAVAAAAWSASLLRNSLPGDATDETDNSHRAAATGTLPSWARVAAGFVFYSQVVIAGAYAIFVTRLLLKLEDGLGSETPGEIVYRIVKAKMFGPEVSGGSAEAEALMSFTVGLSNLAEVTVVVAQFIFWGVVAHFRDDADLRAFVANPPPFFGWAAKACFITCFAALASYFIYQVSIYQVSL